MSGNRAIACGAIVLLGLCACGGADDASVGTTSPIDSTIPATVTSAASAAATTMSTAANVAVTEPVATMGTAAFTGPKFVDTVDAALAPYDTVVGQNAAAQVLGSVLPLVVADVPIPNGLSTGGARRSVEQDFDGTFEIEHTVGFPSPFSGADLEGFGANPPSGWTKASFSTSGSLTTLLLTAGGGKRRVAYVSEGAAASTTRAPLEMTVEGRANSIDAPAWASTLPAMSGGELIEFVEGSGEVSTTFQKAGGGYVMARWRYPESTLGALNDYLESGVVQSAGFSFDLDVFNGFETMVDVTAGAWEGSVIIGNASMNDENFYDLVWTLSRT